MKFKGEAGTTGISVGGQFFQADADGVVEVPDDGNYAQALAPFGFVPAPKATPAAEPDALPEPTAKPKRAPKAAPEPAAEPAAEGQPQQPDPQQ